MLSKNSREQILYDSRISKHNLAYLSIKIRNLAYSDRQRNDMLSSLEIVGAPKAKLPISGLYDFNYGSPALKL